MHFALLRFIQFFIWQFVQIEYPVTQPGLGDILEYLKQAYGNPPIYIHENGSLSPSHALDFWARESWFRDFFSLRVRKS